MNYCIVDIETTGGNRTGNKITEIAIVKTDGKKILETFESLINPEKRIPSNITYLTGITNEMVSDAPKFYEVAKEIVQFTKDCIFVAHNVFFDYQFIKREFLELGFTFSRKTYCTVKGAREVLPGHKSYSLGKIAPELGIKNSARHRAMGDAMATFELFKIMNNKSKAFLKNQEKQLNIRANIPANIDIETINSIPESCGVYKFFDSNNKILYIGKSTNIKNRIYGHFKVNLTKKRDIELKALIKSIEWMETTDELAALVIEACLIKKHRPKYNVRLKSRRFIYGVFWDGEKLTYARKENIDQRFVLVKNKRAAEAKIKYIYEKSLGIKFENILSVDTTLSKWRLVLGEKAFGKRIVGTLFDLEYPSEYFFLTKKSSHGEGHVRFRVNESALSKVEIFDKEENLTFSMSLIEDPEVKTIFMSHIKKLKLEKNIEIKNDTRNC
tara:strand:+ start:580 stop:1905 length:1326 start_codon:yes stop_codon:yes gene_type:complete